MLNELDPSRSLKTHNCSIPKQKCLASNPWLPLPLCDTNSPKSFWKVTLSSPLTAIPFSPNTANYEQYIQLYSIHHFRTIDFRHRFNHLHIPFFIPLFAVSCILHFYKSLSRSTSTILNLGNGVFNHTNWLFRLCVLFHHFPLPRELIFRVSSMLG